jgi:transcriptional regulator with XRE-family HTH domain
MSTFAESLKREMDAKGWDVNELACACNVDPNKIQTYLRGSRPPHRVMRSLAYALRVQESAFGPSFGQMLRQMMNDRDVTCEELACHAYQTKDDAKYRWFREILESQIQPRLKVVRRIAAALNVPLGHFAGCWDVKLSAPPRPELVRRRLGGVRFADVLNRHMREKNVTVEQLAERTGILAWHIHKYTTGEQWPKERTMETLAAALGVSDESFVAIRWRPQPRPRKPRPRKLPEKKPRATGLALKPEPCKCGKGLLRLTAGDVLVQGVGTVPRLLYWTCDHCDEAFVTKFELTLAAPWANPTPDTRRIPVKPIKRHKGE